MSENQKNELQLIQKNFEIQVAKEALEVAPIESIESINHTIIQEKVKKKLQVNVDELADEVYKILDKNDKLSDEEIAIQLLKKISLYGKSKFMRKLATEMLKEKWWKK
ncbi:hypothetical protein [Bacillus smithii]|jgi:restriction endonuclease Mrr|uniref:hypothetical protein n=1 Tax=Bacillus smithii TaxID=1479 RepID=UPI003D20745B